jgi:hypothetical protein
LDRLFITAATSGTLYYYIENRTLYWLISSDVFWFLFIISSGALVALDRGLKAASGYRQG